MSDQETLDELLSTDAAKLHNEEVRQEILEQRALFLRVFNNSDGKSVLKVLEEFCYVNKSSANIMSPYATYLAEGRREVYLVLSEVLRDIQLNNKGGTQCHKKIGTTKG